jgi:hypothetical protein
MKLIFSAGAIICALVAAVLFLRQQLDAAFVAATIAAVAGFLSYRVKMKALIADDVYENTRGEDLNENTDN